MEIVLISIHEVQNTLKDMRDLNTISWARNLVGLVDLSNLKINFEETGSFEYNPR